MGPQITAVLNHKLIAEPRQFVSEYSFSLRGLAARITIRTYLEPDGRYYFEQSHHIHTPIQIDPYLMGNRWAETEELAVRAAVAPLLSHYEVAIRQGCKPTEDWLIPDDKFFHPE